MEYTKKFEKLENARKVLKKEFIGLDDIIDDIIKSITSWYITHDLLERPTVISLWGMTGTGKTSVIKRLVELLELKDKTVSFDCGRESENNGYSDNLSDKILEIIGDNDGTSGIDKVADDYVFIFDEFQYARTIDEDGNEVIKSTLRPIWNIIDDGNVPIYENRYSLTSFQEFLDDAIDFINEYPEVTIHIENGKVLDKKEINLLNNTGFGMFHFNNSSDLRYCEDDDIVDISQKDQQVIDFSKIISYNIIKKIYRWYNRKEDGLGKRIIQDIKNVKTLNELVDILVSCKKEILTPKILNCSKSLIFIIGNLDEAFKVQSELDHDGDADTFYEMTKDVSVIDIKNALKQRFRTEQISRLGNNLIKYPTLKKVHFEGIIEKELDRIIKEFKNKNNIDIIFGTGIKELLYSEGVCPVQGVRPVLTTISSLITPKLSDIVIYNEEKQIDKAVIKLKNEDDCIVKDFRIPNTFIQIDLFKDDELVNTIFSKIKLQLGELRSPENRKTRYICGIHEAGHAIAMMAFTGEYPIRVIGVDTNKGGTCYTYNKDRDSEISSKRDFENEIMISLGGYLAERVIYGHTNKCLLGSGSDINYIWEILTDAVLRNGYLEPTTFVNISCQTNHEGIPGGLDIMTTMVMFGDKKMTVSEVIVKMLDDMQTTVTNLLTREKTLLKKLGLYLGDKGSITRDNLISIVKEFGTPKLFMDMEKSKEEMNYDWYKRVLLED